jgi:SAM-dependent MidA family methyltransferase
MSPARPTSPPTSISRLWPRQRSAGAGVEIHRQDDFLTGLGLGDRLSGLRHAELEAARSCDEMERLRLRSLKTEVETLLHPRGLGDFRVLVASR